MTELSFLDVSAILTELSCAGETNLWMLGSGLDQQYRHASECKGKELIVFSPCISNKELH